MSEPHHVENNDNIESPYVVMVGVIFKIFLFKNIMK